MLSHANQNLDAIYQQLFTSFENLEAGLKAKNVKKAQAASIKSLRFLNAYLRETGLLGHNPEKLSSPFMTLSDLSATLELPQFPDVLFTPALNTLSKYIADPIWYFHAGLQKANINAAAHYSSVAKKFRKELTLNANQKLLVSKKTITNGISKNDSTSYALLEMMDVFRYMPNEVMVHILVYLTNHDLARMTKVCQRYHHPLSLFRSTLNIRHAFKEVTEGGNIELVRKMTDNNKALLLMKVNYTDYKGQEYLNVTLLQAALRAYNAAMKNMLKSQVEKYHGKDEQEKQIKEEVSRWIMDQPAFDFTSIATAITNSNDTDICAALREEENGTPLCIAFNTFRGDVRKCIIESLNFTPAHLLKARDVYINQETNWSNHQCWLFLRQVFGLVQRYCPAVVLQDFAQGPYYLVEQNEARLGSFKWAHDEGNIIDLAAFCSISGLGHDNYAPDFGREGRSWGAVRLGALPRIYESYFKQCLQNLQANLCCTTDQHKMLEHRS